MLHFYSAESFSQIMEFLVKFGVEDSITFKLKFSYAL